MPISVTNKQNKSNSVHILVHVAKEGENRCITSESIHGTFFVLDI